jgi:hypothetical protein
MKSQSIVLVSQVTNYFFTSKSLELVKDYGLNELLGFYGNYDI